MLIEPLSVQVCPEGEQLLLDFSVPLKVSSARPLVAACAEPVQLCRVPFRVIEPLEAVAGEPPPGSSTRTRRPRPSRYSFRCLLAGSVNWTEVPECAVPAASWKVAGLYSI